MDLKDEPTGGDSPRMSKASVTAAVQASLAICATCAHTRGDHDGDSACGQCDCVEYWPYAKEQSEGQPVVGWVLKVKGNVGFAKRNRIESEFWASLKTDVRRTVAVYVEVLPHGGFRTKKVKGHVIGVEEMRTVELLDVILVEGAEN